MGWSTKPVDLIGISIAQSSSSLCRAAFRVGSPSGARELFTRALRGNSRQTALVRTLSRVATSIRMTGLGYEGAESRAEVYDSRYDLL